MQLKVTDSTIVSIVVEETIHDLVVVLVNFVRTCSLSWNWGRFYRVMSVVVPG